MHESSRSRAIENFNNSSVVLNVYSLMYAFDFKFDVQIYENEMSRSPMVDHQDFFPHFTHIQHHLMAIVTFTSIQIILQPERISIIVFGDQLIAPWPTRKFAKIDMFVNTFRFNWTKFCHCVMHGRKNLLKRKFWFIPFPYPFRLASASHLTYFFRSYPKDNFFPFFDWSLEFKHCKW